VRSVASERRLRQASVRDEVRKKEGTLSWGVAGSRIQSSSIQKNEMMLFAVNGWNWRTSCQAR
jgi:hypothetical protein